VKFVFVRDQETSLSLSPDNIKLQRSFIKDRKLVSPHDTFDSLLSERTAIMVYVKELLLLLAACSIIICVWYHFRAFKKQSLLPQWEGQPKSLVIIPVTQKVLAKGDGQ
jgi:hypothetical protein